MIRIRELEFGEFREYAQNLAYIHEDAFQGTPRALSFEAAEHMFSEMHARHALDIFIAEFPDGCIYGYSAGFTFQKAELKDPSFKHFKDLGARTTEYNYALIGVVRDKIGSGAIERLMETHTRARSKQVGWCRAMADNRPLIQILEKQRFRPVFECGSDIYFRRERS